MNKILFIVPYGPNMNPDIRHQSKLMLDRMKSRNIDIFEYETEIPKLPTDCRPWSKVARVRNHILDSIRLENYTHIMWMDADIILYPDTIVDDLLTINPDGVTAPLVLIENSGRFYDRSAFIIKDMDCLAPDDRSFITGRNLEEYWPYWPQNPTITNIEMACVGSAMLVNTDIYLVGCAKYEDHMAFTDHYPICRTARIIGRKVICCRNIRVYHADLPKYGEQWH